MFGKLLLWKLIMSYINTFFMKLNDIFWFKNTLFYNKSIIPSFENLIQWFFLSFYFFMWYFNFIIFKVKVKLLYVFYNTKSNFNTKTSPSVQTSTKRLVCIKLPTQMLTSIDSQHILKYKNNYRVSVLHRLVCINC